MSIQIRQIRQRWACRSSVLPGKLSRVCNLFCQAWGHLLSCSHGVPLEMLLQLLYWDIPLQMRYLGYLGTSRCIKIIKAMTLIIGHHFLYETTGFLDALVHRLGADPLGKAGIGTMGCSLVKKATANDVKLRVQGTSGRRLFHGLCFHHFCGEQKSGTWKKRESNIITDRIQRATNIIKHQYLIFRQKLGQGRPLKSKSRRSMAPAPTGADSNIRCVGRCRRTRRISTCPEAEKMSGWCLMHRKWGVFPFLFISLYNLNFGFQVLRCDIVWNFTSQGAKQHLADSSASSECVGGSTDLWDLRPKEREQHLQVCPDRQVAKLQDTKRNLKPHFFEARNL